MIQLNLLPEVKSKYLSAERTKRLTILSAMAVSGIAIGVVIILGSIAYGTQKARISSLGDSIKEKTSKLQKIDDLNKILTIQNQLNSLTSLHEQKPVVSRLFTFLPQITPTDVDISNLTIKYTDSSIGITGTAPSLESVNKFVDTLKFTEYQTEDDSDKQKAFSAVVLTSFNKAETEANYSISLSFDQSIFNSESKTITLSVPKITSTRSQTEQPDNAIFKAQPTPTPTKNLEEEQDQ